MDFSGLEGRFKIIQKNGIRIIDDCYNANLDSMKVGINSVRKNYDLEKTTLVLGDMLELGSESKKYHLELASFIDELEVKPKLVITVGHNASHISEFLSLNGY